MINSVLKAIDILHVFSPEEPRLSLGEISRRLDLPKSTTHNLLDTLYSRNFVEKTEDGRYCLGAKIIPLTTAVRVNVEIRDLSAPLLRELAEATRESVYLAILDRSYALYIYAVESPARLRARTVVGDSANLHCTAIGKAILAHVSDEELETILREVGLPRFTDRTIVDRRELKEELEATVARGYAIDRGEHEQNTYCIGAPIYDRRGKILAACSVSGTDPEILGKREADLSKQVVYTAQEISRYMGYVPTRPPVVTSSNHSTQPT